MLLQPNMDDTALRKFLKLDCYDIVFGEEGFTRFSTRKKIIRREEWTNSILCFY